MSDPKIEPCPIPGCGGECHILNVPQSTMTVNRYYIICGCGYETPTRESEDEIIAAHNQLCEYVRAGKAVKKFRDKPPFDDHPDNQAMVFNKGVQACLDRLKVEGE